MNHSNKRLIRSHRRPAKHRRGAMLVLIAIMMIGFMVAVAFSVDVAHMHLSRTELRSATDAASKATASTLADTTDLDRAIKRGQEIAALNTVNGQPLLLARSDFQFGRSEETAGGRFEFSEDRFPRNSVRVDGRRTADSLSGPVPLFFGNLMGMEFFEPHTHATATYIERDIVLVVDRSGSMRGAKFDDLVAAIDVFVETLGETPSEEEVGLASYSDLASEDMPLTDDLSRISSAVRTLSVGGFTSISRGMSAGGRVMEGSRGQEFVERTMIVMTDGRHNRGREPRETAIDLAADGVRIHTITFGSDADRPRMQEVAQIGGGRHFHADTGIELREIYREIALTLSTMITE